MAEITLDEAKKEAASLRKQLNEWAEAYYSKDAPEVEDNVYDQSYNRLLELEKEFQDKKFDIEYKYKNKINNSMNQLTDHAVDQRNNRKRSAYNQ